MRSGSRAARPARPATGWPVQELAAKLGASPEGAISRAIDVWLDLLAEWNAKMDLTAAKDAHALVWLMLADAWILSRSVPSGVTVVDVGAGAGAPGLGLAILRPDLRMTLVESLGKRAAFLRTVIGTLSRTDISLVTEDARALPPSQLAHYDVAMSRATFAPLPWLTLGASLVRDGGSVWVFLAQEEPPALAGTKLAESIEYADDAHASAKKRLVRYSCGVA